MAERVATASYDPGDHPGDRAAAAVVGERWDVVGPRRIAPHAHARGQLIYTERGCVSVETAGMLHVAPPHRAVWLPPGTRHAVSYPREVAFRGVMVDASHCATLPPRATVVQVDPLTRELIREVSTFPWDHDADGPEARIARVLLDRLVDLPVAPLHLPEGRDGDVRRIADALRRDPADPRTFGDWSRELAVGERTLARRFRRDTGLSFTGWRQRLRVVLAVERLGAGDPATTVAFDLGYRSLSAFTTMFTRVLDQPPSRYFAQNDGSATATRRKADGNGDAERLD